MDLDTNQWREWSLVGYLVDDEKAKTKHSQHEEREQSNISKRLRDSFVQTFDILLFRST